MVRHVLPIEEYHHECGCDRLEVKRRTTWSYDVRPPILKANCEKYNKLVLQIGYGKDQVEETALKVKAGEDRKDSFGKRTGWR